MARKILARRLADARGPLFVSQDGTTLVDSNLVATHLHQRRSRFPIAHFTAHDLRRTVASQMAGMGIALEVIALTIGHTTGEKATRTLVRHYVRDEMLNRKKHALEAWDRRLRSILAGTPDDENVTPLHSGITFGGNRHSA
jgi:integrase